MAFGAMVTILVTWWFKSMGISFGPLPTALLALPFGIAGTIALALFTDRTVYRFYREQKAKPVIFVHGVAWRDVHDERALSASSSGRATSALPMANVS